MNEFLCCPDSDIIGYNTQEDSNLKNFWTIEPLIFHPTTKINVTNTINLKNYFKKIKNFFSHMHTCPIMSGKVRGARSCQSGPGCQTSGRLQWRRTPGQPGQHGPTGPWSWPGRQGAACPWAAAEAPLAPWGMTMVQWTNPLLPPLSPLTRALPLCLPHYHLLRCCHLATEASHPLPQSPDTCEEKGITKITNWAVWSGVTSIKSAFVLQWKGRLWNRESILCPSLDGAPSC